MLAGAARSRRIRTPQTPQLARVVVSYGQLNQVVCQMDGLLSNCLILGLSSGSKHHAGKVIDVRFDLLLREELGERFRDGLVHFLRHETEGFLTPHLPPGRISVHAIGRHDQKG